jgi:hypothetical protein
LNKDVGPLEARNDKDPHFLLRFEDIALRRKLIEACLARLLARERGHKEVDHLVLRTHGPHVVEAGELANLLASLVDRALDNDLGDVGLGQVLSPGCIQVCARIWLW